MNEIPSEGLSAERVLELQTGLAQVLNLYSEQLQASLGAEALSDLGIRQMVAHMLSAFTEMVNTEPSTSDLMRILTTFWESALKRGEQTIWHYGVLNIALNYVDELHEWRVSRGKSPYSTKIESSVLHR